MPETTHPSLLSRIRNVRDQEAWRAFDERYSGMILRYCRRRGLQEGDAEDVRQLVLLGLARVMPRFRYRPELGRFRDYLGRATRNAISKRLSCPGPEVVPLFERELEELVDPRGDADELWEAEWMRHHFRIAMAKARKTFDPRSLEVFERVLAGAEPRSVATAFRVSEHAIAKTKTRVRAFLSARIAEQLEHDEFPERVR